MSLLTIGIFSVAKQRKEKEMETQSSILAWRIPGIEEPGGLPSMGSHRVKHNWSDLAAVAAGKENTIKTNLYYMR